MDQIILTLSDKKTGYMKRIILEINEVLLPCEFVTIGSDLLFDKDTEFFQYGYDVTGRRRQLAIMAESENLNKPAKDTVVDILASLKEGFDVVQETEEETWLREKQA